MESLEQATRSAVDHIRQAGRVILACHVHPDADALGSLLGLGLALINLGKEVTMISPDGVPEAYRFLPRWELCLGEPAGSYDLAIGLDADGIARLGDAADMLLAAPRVINVDHHIGLEPYGHIRVVDPTAAATGELVVDLLQRLGVQMTQDVAHCLLAAILTDTGSFRFDNVTARTFAAASALVAAGARPAPIYDAVYGRRSFGASLLLGRTLAGLRQIESLSLVYGYVTLADMEETGCTPEDTQGFVNQIGMIEGSDVALLVRELAPEQVSASLRSRGELNVAAVARRFGGGGHKAAAGCTVMKPLESALHALFDAVRIEMAGGG